MFSLTGSASLLLSFMIGDCNVTAPVITVLSKTSSAGVDRKSYSLGSSIYYKVRYTLPAGACAIDAPSTVYVVPPNGIALTLSYPNILNPGSYFGIYCNHPITFQDVVMPEGVLNMKFGFSGAASGTPVSNTTSDQTVIRDTDLNGDGCVDHGDITALLEHWNQGGWWDINASGTVDADDFVKVLSDWGCD